MNEYVRINSTQVAIDGEIFTKGSGQTSHTGSVTDWLRKGGWTTVAGIGTSLGNVMLSMILYEPKLLDGTMKLQDWATVFMLVGGPGLLGLKAAVTQKPQPETVKPNPTPAATNNVLGPTSQGPAVV